MAGLLEVEFREVGDRELEIRIGKTVLGVNIACELRQDRARRTYTLRKVGVRGNVDLISLGGGTYRRVSAETRGDLGGCPRCTEVEEHPHAFGTAPVRRVGEQGSYCRDSGIDSSRVSIIV